MRDKNNLLIRKLSNSRWTTALGMILLLSGFTQPHSAPTGQPQKDSVGKKAKLLVNAQGHFGERVLRPEVRKVRSIVDSLAIDGVIAEVRVDQHTDAVRLISGKALAGIEGLDLPRKSSIRDSNLLDQYVAAAIKVIESHPDIFSVSSKEIQLRRQSTLMIDHVVALKFDVFRQGIQIEDAEINFRFNSGSLIQITNFAYSEAPLPALGRDIAVLNKANQKIDMAALTMEGRSVLRVAPLLEAGVQKGYQLIPVAKMLGKKYGQTYRVQASEVDGEIFEIKPAKHFSNSAGPVLAQADVFSRYYAEDYTKLPLALLKVKDAAETAFFTDTLGRIQWVESQPKAVLEGKHVSVKSRSDSLELVGEFVEDSWVLDYQADSSVEASGDKKTAQTMLYVHVNKMVAHAKRFVELDWFERPLIANANLAQSCNAFWNGTSINFYSAGNNCANTANIADVVYHEWGHGFDANTGGIQDGAFSEGFGDIMSLIMTRSPILGIGFRLNGDPVRELETDKIYPQDRGGGVHSEGLIIGSTFYDLFKEFESLHGADEAVELLSSLAIRMIFTASRYTDVYDALLALDDDNGNLNDLTPNFCSINKIFAQHGLTVESDQCKFSRLENFRIDDSLGNGNGSAEPGETIRLAVSAKNTSQIPLDGLVAALSFSSDKVVARSGALSWSEVIAPGGSSFSESVLVDIAEDAVCGQTPTAAVQLKHEGRVNQQSFDLPIGQFDGSQEILDVVSNSTSIPDNGSVDFDIQLTGDQWESDPEFYQAQLTFAITHPYRGDIRVYLVSPSGQEIQVYKGTGSGDDINFDQDVLPLLGNQRSKGVWKLKVSDVARRDSGSIESAELKVTPKVFSCQ